MTRNLNRKISKKSLKETGISMWKSVKKSVEFCVKNSNFSFNFPENLTFLKKSSTSSVTIEQKTAKKSAFRDLNQGPSFTEKKLYGNWKSKVLGAVHKRRHAP
jgi:hypothetical protein